MDSVRFQAQERVDLVDAQALQSLVYTAIREALGGVLGGAAGALTTIEAAVSTSGGGSVYQLTMGPCQWIHSEPINVTSLTYGSAAKSVAKGFEAQVVTHVPADEGQAAYTTIDWTAWRNAFNALTVEWSTLTAAQKGAYLPFLWARPEIRDTDSDARREWNVGAGAEAPITIATRQRVITEWQLSTTRPVVAAGDSNQHRWTPVARVVDWTFGATIGTAGQPLPDTPKLRTMYAWDLYRSDLYGDGTDANLGLFSEETVPAATSADAYPATYEDTSAEANKLLAAVGPLASHGSQEASTAAALTAASAGYSAIDDEGWDAAQVQYRLGIPQVMQLMRRAMARMMDRDGNLRWFEDPPTTLNELNTEISKLSLSLAAAASAVNAVTAKANANENTLATMPGRMLAGGVVIFTNNQNLPYAVSSKAHNLQDGSYQGDGKITSPAAGDVRIYLPTTPDDVDRTVVQATVTGSYSSTAGATIHAGWDGPAGAKYIRVRMTDPTNNTGVDRSFHLAVLSLGDVGTFEVL